MRKKILFQTTNQAYIRFTLLLKSTTYSTVQGQCLNLIWSSLSTGHNIRRLGSPFIAFLSGWWFQTLWKNVKVNGKDYLVDYPLYYGKYIMFETTNQLLLGWTNNCICEPPASNQYHHWLAGYLPINIPFLDVNICMRVAQCKLRIYKPWLNVHLRWLNSP